VLILTQYNYQNVFVESYFFGFVWIQVEAVCLVGVLGLGRDAVADGRLGFDVEYLC